jgi:3',5'-nucleoside bisphosphate phosphatase
MRPLPFSASLSLLLSTPILLWAHGTGPRESRVIEFPDLPGYRTLKCDFHQHTVFSDGRVWPTIRVQEAQRDGLDAMAITDHLEHQPHRDDIPHPDRNRSYELAAKVAETTEVLLVNGAEVTRDMPPGHANAIFIEDANALLQDDVVAVFQEAARQGGFIFWNHPSWIWQAPDGVARLSPLHEQLLADGLIHGIEVVNMHTYSEESFQIALDHNLTIMANSDVHGLIDWEYHVHEGGHRPITLVFAAEKTVPALKEALRNRQTAAWYKNTLIGRSEWIDPLLAASLVVKSGTYRYESSVFDLVLENRSDAEFLLRNVSPFRLHDQAGTITVKPHGTVSIGIKTNGRVPQVEVMFEVLNALIAPGKHPVMTLTAAAAAPGR